MEAHHAYSGGTDMAQYGTRQPSHPLGYWSVSRVAHYFRGLDRRQRCTQEHKNEHGGSGPIVPFGRTARHMLVHGIDGACLYEWTRKEIVGDMEDWPAVLSWREAHTLWAVVQQLKGDLQRSADATG